MADKPADFDSIVASISPETSLYAAVMEARSRLQHQHPHGYDLRLLACEVWPQLADASKEKALEQLFAAYVVRLHDEERATQLERHTVAGITNLKPLDVAILEDAVASVAPVNDDTEVDGVCASALRNVLRELDLLRFQVRQSRPNEGD